MIRGRDQQMAPPVSSKAEKKTAADAAAWMFNVVTSVGIIIVNKALMASYGYTFGNQSIQPSSSLTSLVFFYLCLEPPMPACSYNLNRFTFRFHNSYDHCSTMSWLHSAFSSSLHRASQIYSLC